MKRLVAELDNISAYIEERDEAWGVNITWRLDKVAQELEELSNQKDTELSKISKRVLGQYMGSMEFLTNNDSKLSSLILKEGSEEPTDVYKKIKKHFGKISRKEAIDFIKNVIKNNIL